MIAQGLWGIGRTVLAQIFRRGADNVTDRHQRLAVQTRRRRLTDAQCQIHAIINQVHIAVFQPQTDIHVREAGEKLRH
ncbi:hypothetical protein D3C81_1519510 [compost metagenome]